MGEQLKELVFRFDLRHKLGEVRQAYEMLCSESLAIPLGQRPPEFSRINEDGTPFQYALTMGSGRPSPLQFLSEAGIPGSSMIDRVSLSRQRILGLCAMIGAAARTEELSNLLDRVAPATDFELLAENAGAFWLGVRFSADKPTRLIVYINGKWGDADARWGRLNEFAASVGAREQWGAMETLLSRGMKPLGMALTVSGDDPIKGRIYASAYGKPLVFYERVVQSLSGTRFCPLFGQFAEIMLGDERQYPTRSAVCSFGLNPQAGPDFKFELCGHCMFTSDTDAIAKCTRWLTLLDANPAHYQHVLEVIAHRLPNTTHTDVHSYVGFGWKGNDVYGSIYLKPQVIRFPEEQ